MYCSGSKNLQKSVGNYKHVNSSTLTIYFKLIAVTVPCWEKTSQENWLQMKTPTTKFLDAMHIVLHYELWSNTFRKAKSLFKDIMQCHSCKASWGCLLEQIGLCIKLMHQKRGKTKAECIFCAKLLNATTLGKPAKSPTRTQAFPNKTDSISCQILIKTIKGKGYILIREEMKNKFVFQRAKSNMVLTEASNERPFYTNVKNASWVLRLPWEIVSHQISFTPMILCIQRQKVI